MGGRHGRRPEVARKDRVECAEEEEGEGDDSKEHLHAGGEGGPDGVDDGQRADEADGAERTPRGRPNEVGKDGISRDIEAGARGNLGKLKLEERDGGGGDRADEDAEKQEQACREGNGGAERLAQKDIVSTGARKEGAEGRVDGASGERDCATEEPDREESREAPHVRGHKPRHEKDADAEHRTDHDR